MFKLTFQNAPEGQTSFRRVTIETDSETTARDFLKYYAETYDLPYDDEMAFRPSTSCYTVSGAGGFPYIELKKRLSSK